ncbi:hypothetical protein [Oceanibaculum pacificum]|uniref:Uncharacterized protein n=1 Tax=Oceanibaculum pacificum TaxID=580166 RepID=A0A154W2X2_9PROT|nr:hypothetical protein [Oceanibaculum pacificum]KZD07868.1 hypothetical protein AUP43_09615 [Oceanibaculum pacificum]
MERSTHFEFKHRIFAIPGAHFRRSDTGEGVVYSIPCEGVDAVVPVAALMREFGIASDSPDSAMIDTAVRGLDYVRRIHPGDSIPKELLDGTASWTVEERHEYIARWRLQVQLASWVSGDEQVVTDADMLEQIAEDPQTNDKLEKAMKRLGWEVAPSESEAFGVAIVKERVESLVRELTYIEALRDRFKSMKTIQDKLERFAKLFANSRVVGEEVARVRSLFTNPHGEVRSQFDDVDAQTSEIRSLVLNYDNSIPFIRERRDRLHGLSMDWEEMMLLWDAADPTPDEIGIRLIRKTYQFLGRRYAPKVEWTIGALR